ncbi:MAG: tyrosine-type recombinase/integrase [Proteobacteria bacterium]|nr:tyrosine-type recombinase/integrase [Pseudomonadota bacterium]
MYDIGPREWEAFKAHRASGAIDARGKTVEPDKRRQVKPGTVNLGLEALVMCFNWATMWRVNKRTVLDRSPIHKLPFLDDANKQRSVWTYDRFLKILAAAEDLEMEVEWTGNRTRVPCHLADVLVIVEGTGRRIGAVRQLRYADLLLSEGQHGKVRWRADTDKTGKEWVTPISPEVRARLLRVIRERPGLGDAPLFPAPRDPRKPVDDVTLRVYLRSAEKAAGVERLPHDSFHGLRRKFVTERKHLPDVDVAAAGGWTETDSLKQCYQQADEATMLQVVLSGGQLRESKR